MRPKKEVLIGDDWQLEIWAHAYTLPPSTQHSLQEIVEEAIALLSPMNREIFYMRYGEGLPIRSIANALGYASHQIIQAKIARIQKEVKEYVIKRTTAEGDATSST